MWPRAKDRDMSAMNTSKTSEIERLYEDLERFWRPPTTRQTEFVGSLKQPSPLRVVNSVTTYGAYEDPI